jgi:hypothetical protein
MELGLASLGHVSLDSSKTKVNSSKHNTLSRKRLKEKEKELMAEIDSLIEEPISAMRKKTRNIKNSSDMKFLKI